MKRALRQTDQLLRLARALEERERWRLGFAENLRRKEVRALEAHVAERRAAQDLFAERRRLENLTPSELALQAEFLRWSRERDGWHRPRIEAAQARADAQREALLGAMRRRKTIQEVDARLQRQAADRERRKAERVLDEWVIQRWKSDEEAEAGG